VLVDRIVESAARWETFQLHTVLMNDAPL
jgi:hypothetical protein